MERKKRRGDRRDGYLLRGADPMFRLMPFIMKTRSESVVHFEMDLDITGTEKFIREQRHTRYPGLSYTHLFFAAAARAMALHPKLNRFIAGKRVYARKYIRLAMTAKEKMTADAKEYQVITDFDPRGSLFEAAAGIDAKIAEFRSAEVAGNDTDDLINKLIKLPRPLISLVEKLVRFLDYHGWVPESFAKTIPFYSSAYFVNNGSIRLDSVFHHLYELGTISFFVSIGQKRNEYELGPTGEIKFSKRMNVRIVLDERICDGFNNSAGLNTFRALLEHPESLLERYEGELPEDDEIDAPRKKR